MFLPILLAAATVGGPSPDAVGGGRVTVDPRPYWVVAPETDRRTGRLTGRWFRCLDDGGRLYRCRRIV